MKKLVTIGIVTIACIASFLDIAPAQTDPLCESFKRNDNGSWTTTKPVTVESSAGGNTTKVQIGAGQTFGASSPGVTAKSSIAGLGNVVERLEKNCRKAN